MTIRFFLPMQPPTATHHAKQLHAYMKGGKPCAVLHDSPELKNAQAKLHTALAPYRPPAPMAGPLRLVVKWCFPAGRHRDGEYKATKPDTDNLDKALKDQMTKLKFWKDDAQVASEIVEKFWAAVPGIYVEVEQLDRRTEDA